MRECTTGTQPCGGVSRCPSRHVPWLHGSKTSASPVQRCWMWQGRTSDSRLCACSRSSRASVVDPGTTATQHRSVSQGCGACQGTQRLLLQASWR